MSDLFWEIRKIILQKQIVTFFQPVVNFAAEGVFAEEALSRGVSSCGEVYIEPEDLFSAAESQGLLFELELLCLKNAIETFAKKNASDKESDSSVILFLNIYSQTAVNPEFIVEIEKCLAENNLETRRVGIEITETEVVSMTMLTESVKKLREKGFMILIDDFGKGESNTERLISIKPDIIKIDRSLISNIENDVYKKSFVSALQSYANMTGAVCLAEGVETAEEIQCCHSVGISLFQGFAIGKPKIKSARKTLDNIICRIEECSGIIAKQRAFIIKDMQYLADWLVRQLCYNDIEEMVKVLEEFAVLHPEIESLCILDKKGTKLTKTIFAPALLDTERIWTFALPVYDDKNKLPHTKVMIPERGAHYLSEVYISLLSRKYVRTFTVHLSNIQDNQYILCINFYDKSQIA